MSPLIEDGTNVTADFAYYKKGFLKRDDVVLINFSGSQNLLIKSIKLIPGDIWRLENNSAGKYNIMSGNRILTNSQGNPYEFTKKESVMLSIYARDYPEIPADTYLILGEDSSGSLDSTRFGLISGNQIVARII